MSGRPPVLYMVCYDICGKGAPARLRRVYRILRAHGDHLQYSVFRCALTPIRLEELQSELEDVIAHDRDQVLFVPLGRADATRSWRAFTLGVAVDAPERVVRIV
jgi:CRISPR-associated protein Cas2